MNSQSPYDVTIDRGVAATVSHILQATTGVHNALLIHQPALAQRAAHIKSELSAQGITVTLHEIADAESGKTLQAAGECWDMCARAGLTRHDVIIGLGGGAATDLAGFIAATWMRGIKVIQCPTTLLAMVDAALSHALPAVGWMVVLIGSAIGLAALRRVRPLHARAAGGAARNVRGLGAMTVHTTLGMIAMAALQLAMSGTGAPAAASASHAHGGGSGAGLAAVLLASAVAYIVASLVLAVRAHGRLDRAQYAAMGVSVLAMGLAIVV